MQHHQAFVKGFGQAPDETGTTKKENGGQGDEDNVEGVYYFEPYDKRTWLIVGVAIEEGDDLDPDKEATRDYDSLVRIMLDENRGVGDKGVTGGRVELYKAWLTKLAACS